MELLLGGVVIGVIVTLYILHRLLKGLYDE